MSQIEPSIKMAHQNKRKTFHDDSDNVVSHNSRKRVKSGGADDGDEDNVLKEDQSSKIVQDVFMGYPGQYDSDGEDDSILSPPPLDSMEPYDVEQDMVGYPVPLPPIVDLDEEEDARVDTSGHMCSICHLSIHDTHRVVLFLMCGHFFHEICVDVDTITKCPTCNYSKWKLGSSPCAKIEVMPLGVAKILMFVDAKLRCSIVENMLTEKENVDRMIGREFYTVLRENVFAGRIPQIRNLYYKPRVFHYTKYQLVGDNQVDVYLQSGKCCGLCWKEQMCQIALEIFKDTDNSNIDSVMYLLTFYENVFLYFGKM